MAASSMLGQLGGVGGSLVGGLRKSDVVCYRMWLTVCAQSVAGRRKSSVRQVADDIGLSQCASKCTITRYKRCPFGNSHLVRARTTYNGSPERLLGSTVTISMVSYS